MVFQGVDPGITTTAVEADPNEQTNKLCTYMQNGQTHYIWYVEQMKYFNILI